MDNQQYRAKEYNHQPRIRLIDQHGNLIQMVNQVEGCRLLRRGYCELVYIETPTIQFLGDVWDERYLHKKWHSFGTAKVAHWLHASKTVLYGNVHIQGPDGNTMFHCNNQKALWYINRGLADIVGTTPPTLRLRFRPGGPGHVGDIYYLTEKHNHCVVCGATAGLNRHHVLPTQYRQYLPEEIKDHNYHDVLLMCLECHSKYEEAATQLKKQIAVEYGHELDDGAGSVYNREIGSGVSAAFALLRSGDKIPPDRRVILYQRVSDCLGRPATADDLEAVTKMSAWYVPEGFVSHGEYVIKNTPDLQAFTERWRKHFLETMQPKFLPKYWDAAKELVRDRNRNKNMAS